MATLMAWVVVQASWDQSQGQWLEGDLEQYRRQLIEKWKKRFWESSETQESSVSDSEAHF